MPLFLRRLANKLFPRTRRYRDAAFVHHALLDEMSIPFRTRLYRWVFKPEHCDATGKTLRRVRTLRLLFAAALLWLLLAFLTESFRAWNFYSGN